MMKQKDIESKIGGFMFTQLSLPGALTNYYRVTGEGQLIVHEAAKRCV